MGGAGRFTDLKRRLLFLLGALIVYRVGAHIPVPGIDPVQLAELFKSQQGGILDMFNMFSGGALSRFTIFALGIMPYISASIIMQLMSVVSRSSRRSKRKANPAAARSRSTPDTAHWCWPRSRPSVSRLRSKGSAAWYSIRGWYSGLRPSSPW